MIRRAPGRLRARLKGGRDRWRRWVLLGQGAYYVLTGLWPLLHFPSFAGLTDFPLTPYQSQALGAIIIVVGGSLIEAARREPPGPYPTLLGIAVAGAIAIVGLIWFPRLGAGAWPWIDLLVQVAFALALVLLYPRVMPERGRAARRR